MPTAKTNATNDRWAPVSKLGAEQHLAPDDLVRAADAKRLPTRAWIGDACFVDRRHHFNWSQLVRLARPLPQDSARDNVA